MKRLELQNWESSFPCGRYGHKHYSVSSVIPWKIAGHKLSYVCHDGIPRFDRIDTYSSLKTLIRLAQGVKADLKS